MRFRHFLFNESPHGTVNPPYETDAGAIYNIDLHAEHWVIKDSHPEAPQAKEAKNKMLKFAWLPPFYGRLPDGKYLFNDGKGVFNFSVVEKPPQESSGYLDLDAISALDGYWWDYAMGLDGQNTVVKPPTRTARPEILQMPAA